MAQLHALTIGGIILIIVIVIVVVVLVSRSKHNSSSSSSNELIYEDVHHRRDFPRRYRHRVKAVRPQEFPCQKVEHCRRICRPNDPDNRNCVKPAAPIVTVTEQDIETIVVDWTTVANADYYDLFLYRQLATPQQLDPVEVVRFIRGFTTLTFSELVPGNYTVIMQSASDECGLSELNGSATATIQIGCDANTQCGPDAPFCQPNGQCIECLTNDNCPPASNCQNNTCVNTVGQGLDQSCVTDLNCAQGLACQNLTCVCPKPPVVEINSTITTGNDAVISWAASPGADYYEVVLYRDLVAPTADIPIELIQVHLPTTVTFNDLPVGEYRLEVFAMSNSCGGLELGTAVTFGIAGPPLPMLNVQ